MIQILIGTEPAQYIAQQVLIYSIEKSASVPVDIRMPAQRHERKGGTNFGYVRFYTPSEFNYMGKAIYLDADQLVFSDIKELAEQIDPQFDVACVQEPEGYFGGKIVQKGNQTSVMVMNCANLRDWDPDTMFGNVVGNRDPLGPGQVHYRDFMMLSEMEQSRIQPLDSRWNHFNLYNAASKLTHFSHVRAQPWKSPEHDLQSFWTQWLLEAIEEKYVTKAELAKEIEVGHVHPFFSQYC